MESGYFKGSHQIVKTAKVALQTLQALVDLRWPLSLQAKVECSYLHSQILATRKSKPWINVRLSRA